MKNTLTIDFDEGREKATVIIGKPIGAKQPASRVELAEMIMLDTATLCEALCTMIHIAENEGVRPSAEGLRICIKHLQDGFADASYETTCVPDPRN